MFPGFVTGPVGLGGITLEELVVVVEVEVGVEVGVEEMTDEELLQGIALQSGLYEVAS